MTIKYFQDYHPGGILHEIVDLILRTGAKDMLITEESSETPIFPSPHWWAMHLQALIFHGCHRRDMWHFGATQQIAMITLSEISLSSQLTHQGCSPQMAAADLSYVSQSAAHQCIWEFSRVLHLQGDDFIPSSVSEEQVTLRTLGFPRVQEHWDGEISHVQATNGCIHVSIGSNW